MTVLFLFYREANLCHKLIRVLSLRRTDMVNGEHRTVKVITIIPDPICNCLVHGCKLVIAPFECCRSNKYGWNGFEYRADNGTGTLSPGQGTCPIVPRFTVVSLNFKLLYHISQFFCKGGLILCRIRYILNSKRNTINTVKYPFRTC